MNEKLEKEFKIRGWIARDEDGALHLFEVEPNRIRSQGCWWDRDYQSTIIDGDAFPNITWESEPIEVELIIRQL